MRSASAKSEARIRIPTATVAPMTVSRTGSARPNPYTPYLCDPAVDRCDSSRMHGPSHRQLAR